MVAKQEETTSAVPAEFPPALTLTERIAIRSHTGPSDSQAHVVAGIRGRKRHSMKSFKSLSTRRAGRIDSTGKGETCGE